MFVSAIDFAPVLPISQYCRFLAFRHEIVRPETGNRSYREPCRELERLAGQSQRGETEMPDTARATMPSQEEHEYSPARPAHGIPDIGRKGGEFHGRSNWYRIFGLIHMLGSAEDDGPVSKIHY